jgi:hypothetical protein
MNTLNRRLLPLVFVIVGFGFVLASAYADDRDFAEKSVTCGSKDGRHTECSADLEGYSVRDVDQESRTTCVVGRNWGYSNRGVWVDEGCRATFHFTNVRGGNHPRSYGYRDEGWKADDEQRVRCESHDGKRNNCNANLRGYRIEDVREISRADCDIGRNFGYDDRGVWVDDGCRAEFIFTKAWGRRDRRD